MNGRHLSAFIWLRWRLLVNGWRRAGLANFVVTMFLAVAAVVAAVPIFAGAIFTGYSLLRDVQPKHLLFLFDGLALAFVFAWSVGLLTELQRTETLSLARFMHLPVSPRGAFFINYVSSLLSLSTIVFLPACVGLAIGLALSRGVRLLAVLPLSAAFLFMVTAISYQFQGWLASLMSNPRRRRAIVVSLAMVFVLIAQLPNLLMNIAGPWSVPARRSTELAQQLQELNRQFESQQQTGVQDAQELPRRQLEFAERQKETIENFQRENAALQQAMLEQWQHWLLMANWLLPIGWLPLGVMSAAEGGLPLGSLCFLLMSLIGAASLWRAYRTTLRIYQGSFTARVTKHDTAVAAVAPKTRQAGDSLLEIRLPGCSEPVSAIALATFRSLWRSPEAKMMLLSPLIMTLIMGGMLARMPTELPAAARSLLALGAILMVLFGMGQLMANQFGFDRDGFRVFVLCPASRRDILLGKNLGFFPWAAGLALSFVGLVEGVFRLRWDHLLALLPQFVSMYLLFCLLMNLLSICAPLPVAAGSLKPASYKTLPMLLQIVSLMLFFPLVQAPACLPLGLEALYDSLGWWPSVPLFLMLASTQCVAVVLIYRFALSWQGDLLERRERQILAGVVRGAGC